MTSPTLATIVAMPANAPPLRLCALASLTGLTTETLRRDISTGDLRARHRGTIKTARTLWLVPIPEARRYLRQLGLL